MHAAQIMIVRRLRLSAVLLASLLVASSSSRAGPAYVIGDSAAPCLKLRPQPSADAAPIDCVAPGTTVTELESVPYWRRVALPDGREGWVAKKFLAPATAPAPAQPPAGPNPNAWLEVHFVDVGQGDAIWIHTFDDGIDGNGVYEGKNIVIDGGPYSADSTNPLLPYIENRGHHGAVIDALIISHPHTDHFRGAETISRHFQVKDYYDPGYPSTLSSYGTFRNAIAPADGSAGRAERAHFGRDHFGTLDWGSELKAEVLYAWPGSPQGLGSGNTAVNNSSIVLRLEYGSHSFLFMGDAEGKDRHDSPNTPHYVEQVLLGSVPPAKLKATVLKIAHHGSETSSTLPFLQAVDPEIVVVQSGRKSFGGTFLPDLSTLRRYCCHNAAIRIYRTDQNDEAEGLSESQAADGDHVVIRTNGNAITVEAFEAGSPFAVTACEPGCSP